MFLLWNDLVSLTGTNNLERMVDWLQQEGFTFRVDTKGRPKVLAEHVRLMMGGAAPNPAPQYLTQPDLDALKARK